MNALTSSSTYEALIRLLSSRSAPPIPRLSPWAWAYFSSSLYCVGGGGGRLGP